VFKVDYVVEQIGNREFGSIFLGQENLALTIVSNGWAKVRSTSLCDCDLPDALMQPPCSAPCCMFADRSGHCRCARLARSRALPTRS
jgi:hypothetical protein